MNPATNQLKIQLQQLETKIKDTQSLMSEPTLVQLAEEDLKNLSAQKQALETSIKAIENGFESSNSSKVGVRTGDAVVEIRPGAGGDEAKIFCDDLMRMYSRFADQFGFKMEGLDESVVKFTGRKQGKTPYELFKFESGVHRVQRVPATESSGRIHTSTASVAVLPIIPPQELVIREEDLEWQFTRAGGHGGQNVNKVSTAVRLTHTPSGLAVACRQERSQQQNRVIALEMLRSQLWEIEEEKRLGSIEAQRKAAVGRAMRAEKIRTYNYPQNRVTDHRINKSWYSLETIMEGQVQEVLEAITCNIEYPEQILNQTNE